MARHVWKEMQFTVSIKICFFFLFGPSEKGTHFKFQWNFTKKKRKTDFETLFSHSFDMLPSSPMVYMNHTELMFQDLILYCTKKVPKNHNDFFFTFVTGVKHTSCCLLRPRSIQMANTCLRLTKIALPQTISLPFEPPVFYVWPGSI